MAGRPQPDLSIIVVNRNTRDLLRDCLQSIADLPDPVALETIVVDNGSSDESPEMISRLFPWVHLIRNETNTGFAFPNNQGLAVSRGRYVMLLNSDTVVRPNAFRRLVEFMDERPEAGACGPKLYYVDGRPQPSCRSFPSLWVHFCDVTFLDRLFPRSRLFGNQETRFDHRRTVPVDQPMGAALLVRREVLETVGPLDEQFTIYYNDVDWCYRMHCAGWELYFVHDAEIVHYQGVTTRRENESMQLTAEMIRNIFAYYRKHFGARGFWWFRVLTVLGYSIRRVAYLLPGLLRVSEVAPGHEVYVRGMLRTAWTGNPDPLVVGDSGVGTVPHPTRSSEAVHSSA